MLARTATWSLISLGICGVFLAVALYLHHRTGVEYSLLYRDANAIADNPFYYGALESMTASLLIASGAILLFAVSTRTEHDKVTALFAGGLGLLSILLGLDDLFMFHENAWFFYWRLQEMHFYILYATILLVSVIGGWRAFRSSPWPLLVVALVMLAIAAVGDQFGIGLWREDYLEIIGFSFWFCYVVATATALTRHRAPTAQGRTAATTFPPRDYRP